jgi:cytidyltransferase-like protein
MAFRRTGLTREMPVAPADARKIRDMDELARLAAELRRAGKRVVLCHGVFDLLHIGHIRHFEAARRHGDVLMITVTPDGAGEEGPARAAFRESLRLEALAALAVVDYVALAPGPAAAASIGLLRPDVFARGPDHADAQADPAADEELRAIEGVGGRFIRTHDVRFSSSRLLREHLSPLSMETRAYLDAVKRRHNMHDVHQWFDGARGLRVAVVGEAIIDEYTYVEAMGRSSKEPLIAARKLSSELFAGGALAVANHLAGFSDTVDLVTVLGAADSREEFIRTHMNPRVGCTFLQWPGAPTIVKRRYIDGYSFTKLFEVYEMDPGELPDGIAGDLVQLLTQRLADYDLVVVVDFGHGMIGPQAIEAICGSSRFLALNVQTNAGNHGFHVLSRYPRADYVSTAENEVRLESRQRRGDLRPIMAEVAARLTAGRLVVTRGKYGCLCYADGEGTFEVPALAEEVADRVGAGDAFLSISSS